MPASARPLLLGIAGGSGSGKSSLARYLARKLGRRAVVLSQDWYYRDHAGVDAARRRRLNFDHPGAVEFPLLFSHLRELLEGRPVSAPRYDYRTHSRLKPPRPLAPAPLLVLEGLLVLHPEPLRSLMDISVFIEVPDDIRLLRRIRRDVEQRRIDLEETLRLYERFVRPMHKRFIAPTAAHATWVWRQAEDRRFPRDLLKTLSSSLAARARPARR